MPPSCALSLGGLAVATFATLFFVPVVYSLLRRKPPQAFAEEEVALAEQDVAVTTTSYRYQAAAIRCCAVCLLPRHRPVAHTERVIDTTIASHYNGAQEPFCS